MITIKTDFEKYLHELEKLDDKMLQKALGAGLTAAAKPIKKNIKNFTPTEKEILKTAVGQRALTKSAKTALGLGQSDRAIQVGLIRRTRSIKLRYIERKITLPGLVSILDKGAKAHKIKAKTGHVLKIGKVSITMVKTVNHPGVKGSGFLQKAVNLSEKQTQELFFQGLSKFIDKLHATR